VALADSRSESVSVSSQKKGNAVVIYPTGDIDLTASPVLRQELKRVQAGRPARLVVDLAKVPYMDSSGVATLVEAMQVARKSGTKMFLCTLTDRVRSIFEIARLDTVFTILPTEDAALNA
jgi:anti-sigma B factor antagonist